MASTNYRTNADGSAVCPHRDLSVCDICATDPTLVECSGVYFQILDPDQRAELIATLAEIRPEPVLSVVR